MKKGMFFILPLLLIPLFCYAQKAIYQFYTSADGLAGNDVSLPVQDAQGVIWLVSNGSLQKFDGRKFMTFPPRPKALSGSEEPFIDLAAYQDTLLLLVSTHHLFILNPRTSHWQSFLFGKEQFFDIIFYRRKNALHFQTVRKGKQNTHVFWEFQNGQLRKSTVFSEIPISRSNKFNVFGYQAIDEDQNTYYIKEGYLYKTDAQGIRIKRLASPEFIVPVNKMDIQADGNLFLIYQDRFFQTDNELSSLQPHPANRFLTSYSNWLFQDFILEKSGSFWACGRGHNLIYYDAQKDTLLDFRGELMKALPDLNDFLALMKDNAGNIWIKTNLGLLKLSFKKLPFQTYYSGIFSNRSNAKSPYSFRGFTEDSRGLIFASYYGGIAAFHPEKKTQFTLPIGGEGKPFLPFGLMAEGDSLFLNHGDLLHVPTQKITKIPGAHRPGGNDNGLFIYDENGKLWWFFLDRLSYLDRSSTPWRWKQVLTLPIFPGQFAEVVIARKKKHTFLIGARDMLLVFDPQHETLLEYNRSNWQLPIHRILAIEEDDSGKIWMGTDIGLVHFDLESNATELYTTTHGLSNNFICGMLAEGDSALWLSTNFGLSRFNKSGKSFINFYEEDGLTYNEFNRASYFKASNGCMYFGGMRGINAFFPETIMAAYQRRNDRAQLILSAFEKVDEKRDTIFRKIAYGDAPTLHLYPGDRSFQFEYLLTDYTNVQEVYYTYKMEGYEDRWSDYTNSNTIRFSSLPVGSYIFRVKARDHRGLEHPSQLRVNLTVHPPWYETRWAYLTYLLTLISLVFAGYGFLRKRWILQNELKKEQEEAIRLKELDTFKSQLYTNLTHEFRTPLTVILGMAEQLEAKPKNQILEGLGLIRQNGRHLLQLINQLLDLSKLENNAFKLHLEQGNVIPFLRYLTQSFRSYAHTKNLTLTFIPSVEEVVMDYDPEQLKQVMTNLISNAVKFTPPDGSIEVGIFRDEKNLIVEVKDSGIGIAPEDIDHIFDRFYQADSSHTRKGEGTGIGLAHTKELVRYMGGNIQVESNVDLQKGPSGTSFTVFLPIQAAADTPLANEPKFLKKGVVISRPNPEQQSESILEPAVSSNQDLPLLLIVEDNPDVVTYLKSCLAPLYQLEVAYNGAKGVEKAIARIPDIIISDVMMPEKNGYELCEILKKDERTSHIPIIMLTAKADTSSKITGLESGADAYLNKPFNKKELLVRLEMMVKKKRQLTDYFIKKFQRGITLESSPTKTTKELPKEDAFISKVRHIVEQHYSDDSFSLMQLADKLRMSRSQLYRKMKALVDVSPSDFIRNYRLEKAKILLQTQKLTVSEVAWQVGYKDTAHFSRSFQATYGMAPSEIHK